ncbi:hypothetical protein PsYK624_093640 [Phanerochaete sordida]|uniref:Uncharacterized protein n=1 Tax=Phanerochaete sordida TaxID=48140 RepID=A0A9P3LFE0_9APHY|nr:hypothetical protein PsYK624_093640 [Phanerochaete sordida]
MCYFFGETTRIFRSNIHIFALFDSKVVLKLRVRQVSARCGNSGSNTRRSLPPCHTPSRTAS